MQTLDIVLEYSQMPAVTSPLGSSQMRLCSDKPQSHKFTPVLSPDTVTDLIPIQHVKPYEAVMVYPYIHHPYSITIYKSNMDEDMMMAPALPEV